MKQSQRIVLGCLALLAATGPARSGHAAPRPGRLGPDLFLAIRHRDLAGVRRLLARGADPNARNALQFTPLMFAAVTGQLQTVKTLLAAGTPLDAASPFGTALTFAELGGSVPVVQFLLARGARVDPHRPDGITVLMMAARNGHTEILRQLLDRKAPLQSRDNDGGTALIYAARAGRTEAARFLLGRGAAVEATDSRGWTALMHAAVNGHAACVALLLDSGARANTRDRQGRTPLMLAATYGDQPAVLRSLLDHGADPGARDGRNRTALELAQARGNMQSAHVLRERDASALSAVGPAPENTPQRAIAASLPLLQRSMRVFLQRTGCVSCHQEGLGRMATGFVRQRGVPIDTALARDQAKRISGMLAEAQPLLRKALKDPSVTKTIPFVDIGELTTSYGFALAGAAAHEMPANEALATAALILARQQAADGSWPFTFQRVPIQSSPFATTALALRVMKRYAPRWHAAEIDRRIQRAQSWLAAAPAETTDDKAFRLLGLKWAGASLAERRRAVEALCADQRPNGGWAQLGTLKSDAYATGLALFALNQGGGLPASDPIYRRGVRFLLQNQEDDGSWFVDKRAIPANNYFDAGFPHGQSQYLSFGATCWATMALTQAVEPPLPGRATTAARAPAPPPSPSRQSSARSDR